MRQETNLDDKVDERHDGGQDDASVAGTDHQRSIDTCHFPPWLEGVGGKGSIEDVGLEDPKVKSPDEAVGWDLVGGRGYAKERDGGQSGVIQAVGRQQGGAGQRCDGHVGGGIGAVGLEVLSRESEWSGERVSEYESGVSRGPIHDGLTSSSLTMKNISRPTEGGRGKGGSDERGQRQRGLIS